MKYILIQSRAKSEQNKIRNTLKKILESFETDFDPVASKIGAKKLFVSKCKFSLFKIKKITFDDDQNDHQNLSPGAPSLGLGPIWIESLQSTCYREKKVVNYRFFFTFHNVLKRIKRKFLILP